MRPLMNQVRARRVAGVGLGKRDREGGGEEGFTLIWSVALAFGKRGRSLVTRLI